MHNFTSRPLPLTSVMRRAARIDLELPEVDMGGPSGEIRVFFDNPKADSHTPTDPEHGFAGSLYVYAYGPIGRDSGPDSN